MLAGQRPEDDHSAVHVDTTPTCTRANAHVSRAHIAVHNSLVTSMPWLKVQGFSVTHFSKTLSCLRHVFVRCAFHSFPSCRFISCLFSVTTFSVIDIIGEDQINPLLLCSLEWNIWLLGQSNSTHMNRVPSQRREWSAGDDESRSSGQEPKGGRRKRSKQPSYRGVDLPSLTRGERFTLAHVH